MCISSGPPLTQMGLGLRRILSEPLWSRMASLCVKHLTTELPCTSNSYDTHLPLDAHDASREEHGYQVSE